MSDYKKIKTEYAKKTKTRKKKTNNVLIGAIILLCLSITLFAFTFKFIYQYNDSISYQETEMKSYTFVEIKTGRGRWLVYVEEENNPLFISTIVMDFDLKDDLLELEKGTKIFCRVIDVNNGLKIHKNSYEIVEMETGQELLTLEEYNERTKGNAIIGIIVCPIVGAMLLFLSFLFFKYR